MKRLFLFFAVFSFSLIGLAQAPPASQGPSTTTTNPQALPNSSLQVNPSTTFDPFRSPMTASPYMTNPYHEPPPRSPGTTTPSDAIRDAPLGASPTPQPWQQQQMIQ